MKKHFSFFLVLFISLKLNSQSNKLDVNFGENGLVTTKLQSRIVWSNASALTENDEIIVAGSSYINEGDKQISSICLVKYTAGGIIDKSFGKDGLAEFSNSKFMEINSIVLNQRGEIIVGGSSNIDDKSIFLVCKFTPEGKIDSSFNNKGFVAFNFNNSNVNILTTVKLCDDNSILLMGYTHNGSNNDFAIAKLDENGFFKSEFGNNGKVVYDLTNGTDNCYGATIQKDGKILLVGHSGLSRYSASSLIRIFPTGELDKTFGENGVVFLNTTGVNEYGTTIGLQNDEKILVCTMSKRGLIVSRLIQTGAYDSAFSNNGVLIVDSLLNVVNDLIVLPDNKLIVIGSIISNIDVSNFGLVKITETGLLDNSFGKNGLLETSLENFSNATSGKLQKNNKLVVVGSTYSNQKISKFALARYILDFNTGVIDFNTSGIDQILFFPNPVKSEASLKYELLNDMKITISLYNSNNKLISVLVNGQKRIKGENIEKLKFSEGLPNDIYFVVITSGKSDLKTVIKIIKQD